MTKQLLVLIAQAVGHPFCCTRNRFWNGKPKLLLSAILLTTGLNAQIGINTIEPKAALDVASVNSGVLIPRMTAAQIELIASPSEGELVFSTTDTGIAITRIGFWYYNGSVWLPIIATSSTGENIYNTDGILLANRTVTMANHNLDFGPGKLFINGTSGNVGVNTDLPTEKLDVNGDMRIRNLGEGNVVATAQGELTLDTGLIHKYGDIRFSYLPADHDGWYLLDGRSLATLPATVQTQATNLGIVGNLPNATGLYAKQGTPGVISGSANVTLVKANMPDYTLTGNTASSGHSHDIVSPSLTVIRGTNAVNDVGGNVWGSQLAGGSAPGSTSNSKTYTSASAGGHSHTITAPTGGSSTAITLNPSNVRFNYFIYLGK